MGVYYANFAFILAGTGICLVGDAKWRVLFQRLFIPLLLVWLLCFAALRGPGVDRDYVEYLDWFRRISTDTPDLSDWIKDPGFVLLGHLLNAIGASYLGVLFAITLIALTFQTVFLKMIGELQLLTLALYLLLCRFYIAQDMTQIRAAAAIPLMSIAILLAYRHKKAAGAWVFLGALAMHLSALLGLPILILALCGVRFRSRYWIFWLIPLAGAVLVGLSGLLETVANLSRVSTYINGQETEGLRLLSVYFVVRIVVLSMVVLGFWGRLSEEGRLIAFCSAVGLALQVMLSANNVLALRAAEVFGLFDVALFVLPIKLLGRYLSYVYAVFLLALGATFFVASLKIIEPYRSILFS